MIGNESADAIAKHAALHNYGHDEAFSPPSPDGNPFAHVYWLAEENNETTHTTTNISLAPLQNIKDKLKAHMSKHHILGDANTNSGDYNYWKGLLTFVNLTTSNSFWNNTRINVSQKRNVMKFRTGTLYTQKMAHLYGRATSSSCLLCHQPDSQIHMLSGCQHASIKKMVTERHNIASRLIIKTLNKGDFGGNIIFTDIGSETRMAQQGLVLPAHVANRTLPQWLLPNQSADELRFCSRPDAICILPVGTKNDHQRDIQDVHPSRWDVHLIEVKYCDDTRPEQQLARATEQHNGLKHALAQQGHKLSLHNVLIEVMGTIYKCHTELPLSKLGLDRCRVRKLTLDLNTHSIQYATKIINTSRRLKNIKERTYGSSQNPPDPH